MKSLSSFVLKNSDHPKTLVVFLHGLGSVGERLTFLYKALSIECKEIIGFFPTAPIMPVTMNGGYPMTAWFDIESITEYPKKQPKGLQESIDQLLFAVQDLCLEYPSIKHIDLIGFSQGGVIALALSHHLRVRSLSLLSTFYPKSQTLSPQANHIFMAHGGCDDVVPFSLGHNLYERLCLFKELKIEFHRYPAMQHHIDIKLLYDLIQFFKKI